MRRWKYLFILLIFLCQTVYAGEDFLSLLNVAKKSYKEKNYLSLVETLREAIYSIWDKLPLTVKNVYLIKDKGNYETRHSNVYAPNEKIYITGELLGYKIKKIGQLYLIDISTDFYVIDEDENIVGGKRNFGRFTMKLPFKNTEFKFDLAYVLKDAPNGKYRLQTVIHDLNSDKTAEFIKEIIIKR